MFISKPYLKRIKIKRIRGLVIIGVLCLALLSGFIYACSSGAMENLDQTYDVTRQDFDILVSSDGTLDMPNQFDLKFGTTGEVKDILVEEGQDVKEGAILAFLDSKAQINTIKSALFNYRTAINAIGQNSGIFVYTTYADNVTAPVLETVSVIIDNTACNPLYYATSYPDLSAPMMTEEAQKDLQKFREYFENGEYKNAGEKLAMTYFDIEVCEDLISSKIEPSVVAGAKPNSVYEPYGEAGTETVKHENYERALKSLANYRDRLMKISGLMMKGDYDAVSYELEMARQELLNVHKNVENTVYQKGWNFFTFHDVPTSLNFLQMAMRSLNDIEDDKITNETDTEKLAENLYLAKSSLTMGYDVLRDDDFTYFWGNGINWKNWQQYNLAVQSSDIAFYNAKQSIMNNVIIAPTDGTVVSVDLKEGYPLSAQTYSSSTAVKLVDTSTIRFTGLVDEIDILKVETGQKVRLAVDAVPNTVFTGTVKFISPFGQLSGNVIKFPVTIELDKTDTELRGGLNATADITIYSAEDVVVVPVSFVATDPAGSTVAVIDPDTGEVELRKVTIGEQDLQYVEVLNGLEGGEKLAVPDNYIMNEMGAAPPPTTTSGSMRSLR
jgi:multidrug efflux pump subunit AcrA (membrane-fusion protein)